MDVSAGGGRNGDDAGQAVIALDDALYYLRLGSQACADRHFDRARRFGATGEQIEAVRATARTAGTRARPVQAPRPARTARCR
jgi:hypothetical protein